MFSCILAAMVKWCYPNPPWTMSNSEARPSNQARSPKHENLLGISTKVPEVTYHEAVSVEKAVLRTVEGTEATIMEQTPVPCFRCGICCTCYQPPLSREDIDNIAAALGISRAKCISRYAVKVPIKEGYLLKRGKSGCIFLAWQADGRARCTIHPYRPKACREWIPSLAKPACLEGLSKLKSEGQVMLLDGVFSSREQQEELYRDLRNVTRSLQK
jgi:Fe-S-cluster containining protein